MYCHGKIESTKTEKALADEFVKKFTQIMNEKILGTSTAPGQWKMHFEKDAVTNNYHKL